MMTDDQKAMLNGIMAEVRHEVEKLSSDVIEATIKEVYGKDFHERVRLLEEGQLTLFRLTRSLS